MERLHKLVEEFFSLYPNGTKVDYVRYVRKKEREQIKIIFEQYRDRKLKELSKNLF